MIGSVLVNILVNNIFFKMIVEKTIGMIGFFFNFLYRKHQNTIDSTGFRSDMVLVFSDYDLKQWDKAVGEVEKPKKGLFD